MNEFAAAAPPVTGLSETQRVVNSFTAPTTTFRDLRRKATFWGPLIIMIVVSIGFSFAVQQKIGWGQVYENVLSQSPAQAAKIDALPNAASVKAISAKVTAIVSYVYVIPVLIITAIFALLLWVTVNFGFGGTAKYGQIYAVSFYANLVVEIKYILAIIAIFAGLAPDSFFIKNPLGSNIGYYLGSDTPLWLRSLCTHIDIFEIWALVLTVIGVSIVAKVSRGKAATVVVGWWIIIILIGAAAAALKG